MIEILKVVVDTINAYIWTILVYVLLGAGIYFTLKTKFVQFRHFKESMTRMKVGKRASDDAISPFQAFATGLASRVGTGNIAGVAIALVIGGPGAIFWMWITALIGMSSAFIESSLGQLYKVQNKDGSYRGGPAYYITIGLGQKWLGIVFALSLILAFGFVFNAVQSNTMVAATHKAWGWNAQYVGIGLVLIVAPIIFGGIKRVAKVAEKIVPIMAILYLLAVIYMIITNITMVPKVIYLIISEAFNFKAAGGGAVGVFTVSMMQGIKRGLFSNEAGMGSVPNAAAASDAYHPANQGLIQMLGVFVDTIIICSCTAFIILLSGVYGTTDATGAELTQMALEAGIGSYGSSFLAIIILLFCFSSIVGNYAYAESNVQFIKNNKFIMISFRILVLAMVYFGSIQELPLVWNMADASMGIMAFTNLISILLLSPAAFLLLKDFEEQVKAGKNPEFDINKYPNLKEKIKTGIWEK